MTPGIGDVPHYPACNGWLIMRSAGQQTDCPFGAREIDMGLLDCLKTNSVGRTPEGAEIEVVPTREITDAHIASFRDMLEVQGHVSMGGIDSRIRKAYRLGFVKLDDKVIGIGAIKRPLDSYLEKLTERSGKVVDFEFEIGWFYLGQDARGVGLASKLGEKLADGLGRVMATTRANNRVVRFMLGLRGFKPFARYPSQHGEHDVLIYECIRE